MAIVLTAGTAYNSGATTPVTSGTVTLPTGLTTGDVTVVFCAVSAGSAPTITAPGGWNTAVANFASGGSTLSVMAVFWRAWVSGDTNPTFTCTSGRLIAAPLRVQGADPVSFVDQSATDVTLTGSGTTAQIPSVTPTTGTVLLGMVGNRALTTGVIPTWTPPAGTTELFDEANSTASTANASLEVFYETLSGTSATGILTATASQTVFRQGAALTINPASSGGASAASGAVTLTGTASPSALTFRPTAAGTVSLTGSASPSTTLPQTKPGLKVEVAFGTNPNDPAAVAAMTPASWTDISGRVREVQCDRPKRTAELDRFEAGTAKLTLDNFDGTFSPTNTSSPYAGNLVPYRMIRTRALAPTLSQVEQTWPFDTTLGGWAVRSPASGTGATCTLTGFPRTGTNSLQWQAGSGSFSGDPGVFVPVATTPGASYQLTGWVWQTSLIGSGLRASAAGATLPSSYGATTTTTGAWVQISTPVIVARDTSTNFYFFVNGTPTAGATFHLDDVTLTSNVYPLWQGYVERWPTSWADPAQGLCDIECVDAMAVAAQIGMTSFYTSEVLADAPLYYYPLTDDSTATAAANQSTTAQQNAVIFHNNIAAQSETYAFGSTLPIPGAEQQGLQFTRGSGGGSGFPGYALRLPFVQLPWATGWTIEFWASLAAGDNGCLLYIQDQSTAQNVPFIQLFVSFSGVETVTVRPPGSSSYSAYTIGTTENVADGIPRHYVMSYDGAKLQFYRNGNDEGWISMASGSALNTPSLIQVGSTDTVGAGVPVKNSEGSPGVLSGTVGQLAIYPQVLTAARVRTHYNIGWLGLAGQVTGQRAGSLMVYADWPSAFSLVYTGSTTFQAATNITNRSLLECLQDVADTEQSELFSLADGRLCLTYRGQRMDQTAPVATFGGNVAAGEIPVLLAGLQLDYDPTLVYNDVSIARNGGSTPRVYDAASILSYFTRSFSRTSYADNDQDAQNAAAWLLDRYAQPQLRAETITIDAAAMGSDVPNFWATILGLDLSDRVLLNHDPLGPSPLIALPGFVDQLSHVIDPDAGTWTVTIQISPLFHQYFALASATDPTWDAASTPDANGYIYLSY